MKTFHSISIPRSRLAKGSADLEDQIRNSGRVPLRDMSVEAFMVFQEQWDPAVDGTKWPPDLDVVLIGFPEEAR